MHGYVGGDPDSSEEEERPGANPYGHLNISAYAQMAERARRFNS